MFGYGTFGQVTFGQGPEETGAVLLFLRPDADDSDGGWTNELGVATDLFASIDESSPDDDDFIQSSISPSSDICRVRLSAPASGVGEPVNLRYRYKKTGTETVDLTVRLLEGSTPIAEWQHVGVSSSFVTATQTLTGPQFAAISDFGNLYIEFEANVSD